MCSLINTVLKCAGGVLGKILLGLVTFACDFMKYILGKSQESIKEKENQKIKEHNDKVKDACDNGTVEDLIDL